MNKLVKERLYENLNDKTFEDLLDELNVDYEIETEDGFRKVIIIDDMLDLRGIYDNVIMPEGLAAGEINIYDSSFTIEDFEKPNYEIDLIFSCDGEYDPIDDICF